MAKLNYEKVKKLRNNIFDSLEVVNLEFEDAYYIFLDEVKTTVEGAYKTNSETFLFEFEYYADSKIIYIDTKVKHPTKASFSYHKSRNNQTNISNFLKLKKEFDQFKKYINNNFPRAKYILIECELDNIQVLKLLKFKKLDLQKGNVYSFVLDVWSD